MFIAHPDYRALPLVKCLLCANSYAEIQMPFKGDFLKTEIFWGFFMDDF